MDNFGFGNLARRSAKQWFARRVVPALLMSLAAVLGSAAAAQTDWAPTKPIRLVVPFSPGGGGDTAARILAQALGGSLGQPVVVENKAGASGAIASEFVYNASPDGHTFLLGTADTQSMNPHVHKVRFDSLKYEPVVGIAKVSFVLVGRKGLGAENLTELLALAERKSLSYGSSGTGAASHVQTNMFAEVAKVTNLLHVPYQGAGPAFQGLLGGQVDLMMAPISAAVQHRDRLTFFGVASLERNDAIKDVPTLGEQGYPVDGDSWVCLLAPPDTPAAVSTFIAQKVSATLADAEVQRKLKDVGMTPFLLSPKEFEEFYRAEYTKWGKAIQSAGIEQQ
jgi:tripartite-type tricarboxylate transporter receptor subunit TctC